MRPVGVLIAGWLLAAGAPAAEPRLEIPLQSGWLFQQGPQSGDAQSAAFDDSRWTRVTLPHTWNRLGNDGVVRSPQTNAYRGASWYRLRFPTPASLPGHRAFLQFDGVGAVAEVWVNGRAVGRHEGAFSRFRFDVTAALHPEADNLLVVKADNSKPQPGSPTEHVIPLAGDFFIFGGLYRNVSLILTAPVHVDMADFGGPGVYGRALAVTTDEATVAVSTRVANDAAGARKVTVATRIEDAQGHVVAAEDKRSALEARTTTVFESQLRVEHPRRWQGVADPYLYRIVVTLRSSTGEVLDEVRQPLGLRTIAFDPDQGFFLNGEHHRLVGGSMHQDRPVKGWAVSRADRVQDFDLLQEMGGNAVRLAHYQHDQVPYELADERGIVAWAEIPLVSDSSFDGSLPSAALVANAQQQLNELIRQNFNHPSIVVWSIGNEVDLRSTVTGRQARSGDLLRTLNAQAKALDPGRFTTMADCCEQSPTAATPQPRDVITGITDTFGYNRYFGWYYGKIAELGPYLDAVHALRPKLPIAVSEYGAGSALTQHSDNALGGPIDSHGRPHPEEVQIRYHEEAWRQMRERRYLWGVFVWCLFDFSSDDRNEGDLTDINEKGLVSYDRSVKKDAFYFYQANWSATPSLHLVGRRYTDRPYGVVDVKAYSNATEARISVNGRELDAAPCTGGVCLWPNVRLAAGVNTIVATARMAGQLSTDTVQWTYSGTPSILRIKAGDVSGFVTAEGTRYGSDNFFDGGEGMGINPPGTAPSHRVAVTGTAVPALYENYRTGHFTYELPLPDGKYRVTLRFVEPAASSAGERLFDVAANGSAVLSNVDPFALAGGRLKAVDRSFKVKVTGGRLRIEFQPRVGQALVSTLEAVAE
ncbi:MAG TPA: glycoside hydrolase family 2 TIM barrel-domain containing protein [Steroidobacteraceae bacterium]|nr:glycoside hydrolase family 2 TIM barrel-domain containing protein [Steroidobacteraceae bacterium]